MKTVSKALIGTVAAGAMAMASASPAMARDNDRRDHDGISAGEVIAGALILGGIAAVASAAANDRYDRYDGYRYRDRWGSPRSAVERCVHAAERSASRWSYGRNAKVTDIRDIDRKNDGWNDRYRGYDAGKFTCKVRYGRVTDVDFSGIRGLR
jgi:hypothetical protein